MDTHQTPVFSFEKLQVWQKARVFYREVYTLTKQYPPDQQFSLVSQLRRAALSVPSNIAEGASRLGSKEFLHFISIAYGSLMEAMNQLILSEDLGLVGKEQMQVMRNLVAEIARMLSSLRKTIQSDSNLINF